ncbi:MAG: NAD(P)H-hydrate dehydratase [Oscillospiraceae bacterium]|nr:NAD(P)H-hydrate dehydratase [Oscillospiraceae bacterium]
MKVLTADQVRHAEELGHTGGVSYETMMETAGTNAAKLIAEDIGKNRLHLTFVCGKGKNGGDGFVAARWICENTQHRVSMILALGEPNDAMSQAMLAKLKATNAELIDYHEAPGQALESIAKANIIVDALFGIGLAGEVRGAAREVIEHINKLKNFVYALDIPSGLLCDSNTLPPCNVKADLTVTMLAPKPALVMKPTSFSCGKVLIAGIGIPEACVEQAGCAFFVADKKELRQDFPPRAYDAHKGCFGHVLCVCGSYQMPGAAVLAAKAALSSGAGLVSAAFPSPAYPAITAHLVESVFLPVDANENGRFSARETEKILNAAQKASVVLLGCGMGTDGDTASLTRAIIKNVTCPLILDADGINIVASDIHMLKEAKGQIVMTPHPGEMARLCGTTTERVNENRQETAKAFAREHNVTLLLKGANTVIAAPDGTCYMNPTGVPALARGGSGDVLSGIIAAFAAQGLSPLRACVAGAYFHGAAAEGIHSRMGGILSGPEHLASSIPGLIFGLFADECSGLNRLPD